VNAGAHCWKACWCRRIMCGTACAADKDVRCDQARQPPIRPRSWWAGTRFRWSGACTATLSGAVCAGSDPAGGTGRRINSNTLTILGRLSARRLTCGNAATAVIGSSLAASGVSPPRRTPTWCSRRPGRAPHQPGHLGIPGERGQRADGGPKDGPGRGGHRGRLPGHGAGVSRTGPPTAMRCRANRPRVTGCSLGFPPELEGPRPPSVHDLASGVALG
jgi:hypothetical protein